jgi:hypothetical protein
MPKRLAILAVVLAAGCNEPDAPPPESGANDPPPQLPPDPFGPVPRHPPEVTRLLNLFPGIPAGGTLNDTVAYLGLSMKDRDRGDGNADGVNVGWPIPPGYRLWLYFDRTRPGFAFTTAEFLALGKPGCPADEWNIVYPWRRGNRMVTSPTWRPGMPD